MVRVVWWYSLFFISKDVLGKMSMKSILYILFKFFREVEGWMIKFLILRVYDIIDKELIEFV